MELALKFRKEALESGLLRRKGDAQSNTNPSTVESPHAGVSLAFLEELASIIRDLHDKFHVPESTADVVQHVLIPGVSQSKNPTTPSPMLGKTRLWDFISSRYGGEPQWYVSHCWSGSFLELIGGLVNQLAPPPGPAEPDYPVGFKEGIIVYLDIFAISVSEAAKMNPSEAESKIQLTMSQCEKGFILALDRKGECLTRAWVIYEVFIAARERRADVNIALPGGAKLNLSEVKRLREAVTHVDIAKSRCSRSQDYTYILGNVKHIMGVQRTNALVNEVLSFVIQCKLRWRGGVWYKAVMGVLMLQAGDLGLLQLLLHSIPELQLSEQRFRELKSIFVSYDKDSSGELDAEEFITVLKASGWEENEAENAYVELAPDGKSGIKFDKFEGWWRNELLGLNKQKKAAINPMGGYDPKSDTSITALADNLVEMSVYLERQGPEYAELSDQYYKALDMLNSGRYSAFIGKDNKLIMPTMAPSLTALLEKISLRLKHDDDVVGALKLMHEILMDNKAILDRDPGLFKLPDEDLSIFEYSSILASWMDALGRVLRYQKHPKASQQGDYLRLTSRSLMLRDAFDRSNKSIKTLKHNVSTMNGFSLEAEGSGGLKYRAYKQVASNTGVPSNLLSSGFVKKAIKETRKGADGMLTMEEMREAQISLAEKTAKSRQRSKPELPFLNGMGQIRSEMNREVREEKLQMNKEGGDYSPLPRSSHHSVGGEASRPSPMRGPATSLDTTFKPPSLADLRSKILAQSISRREEAEGMSTLSRPARLSLSGYGSTEAREEHLSRAREADASRSLSGERSLLGQVRTKRLSMSGAGRTIVTLPSLKESGSRRSEGGPGGRASDSGVGEAGGGRGHEEVRLPTLTRMSQSGYGGVNDGDGDSPRYSSSRFSPSKKQQPINRP